MGTEKAKQWIMAYDPGRKASAIKAQIFFETVANDKFFSVPSAMKSLSGLKNRYDLLVLENQDHFLNPYATQHLKVMKFINENRRMPIFPKFIDISFQTSTNKIFAKVVEAEDFKFKDMEISVVYTDQQNVQSFSRAWLRKKVKLGKNGAISAKLSIVQTGTLWVYILCEISGGYAVSSEIKEFKTIVKNSENRKEFKVDGNIPIFRQPIGDRISPQVELDTISLVHCYRLKFSTPNSKAVIYANDGSSIENSVSVTFKIFLEEDAVDINSTYFLLISDYHGFEEREYGCLLARFVDEKINKWQNITIPISLFEQLEITKRPFGLPERKSLDSKKLSGAGIGSVKKLEGTICLAGFIFNEGN